MRPVLKYPGAKNRLTPWIIDYIPEHKVYVEPFAGSLAVLFAKERSHIETVNDINQDVVNFFRILRDQPEELKRLLQYTPYSRKEYELAYEPAEDSVRSTDYFRTELQGSAHQVGTIHLHSGSRLLKYHGTMPARMEI